MNWGDCVHTETDSQGIEYKLFIIEDDQEVRGNALASGNDAEDKAAEDEILARLDAGETWAWAAVTCVASYGGLTGRDHLGCCSYTDTAQFIQPGGYWDRKQRKLAGLCAKCDKPRFKDYALCQDCLHNGRS